MLMQIYIDIKIKSGSMLNALRLACQKSFYLSLIHLFPSHEAPLPMKLFNRHLMRNQEASTLLELFLVTAVFSVLAIRFFLALTGYPSLSPGNLHIAHVVLGGVLMMVALVIALAFIN